MYIYILYIIKIVDINEYQNNSKTSHINNFEGKYNKN